MTLLKRANFEILTQLHDLLGAISYEAYCCPLNLLHGSSIGQHVRHTVEFYQCLCEQAPLGCIDYDARARDLSLETDAAFAQSAIDALLQKINQIPENQILQLQTSLSDEVVVIPTTTARELVYMAEHAIHHFAIIKIALREQFPQVSLPLHFGVAYSTIKYQSQNTTT
jgi:hypothetical protein